MTIESARGMCFIFGWLFIIGGGVLTNYLGKWNKWTDTCTSLNSIYTTLVGIAFLISGTR